MSSSLSSPGLSSPGLSSPDRSDLATIGPSSLAPVCAGPSAAGLDAIRDPGVGLALWWRSPCPLLTSSMPALMQEPAFCREVEGEPAEAVAGLMRILPRATPLGPDLVRLATLLAKLCGVPAVRLRLEHTRGRTCPRLHVDAVGLRLLCAYAGRGTEWQDAAGTVRRMPVGHVGVFKGTRWPDDAPRVPHRSPAVSDLPPGRRGRLLLCIDHLELN